MEPSKIEPAELFVQPNSRAKRPLIRWMVDHHDEMIQLMTRHRVSWDYATERFTAAGYTAAGNKPLKPETVRSYWKRAQKYVVQERAKLATQAPVSSQPTPPPPGPANQPSPPRSKGFDPIEPENTVDPDDIFSRPLPTISFRHLQTKSSIVTAAEKSANQARDSLSSTRPAPLKPKE